jgi:hypothetical protein
LRLGEPNRSISGRSTEDKPFALDHPVDPRFGHIAGLHPHELGSGVVEVGHAGHLRELRAHRARTQSGAGHAGAMKVGVDRLRERDDEGLGRPVGRLVGQGLEARDRRDVENRALAPLHHVAEEGARELVERHHVEADLFQLIFERQVLKLAVRGEAGVVAHRGDVRVAVAQGVDQPGALSLDG